MIYVDSSRIASVCIFPKYYLNIVYVSLPPPVDVTVKELRKDQHKHQVSFHIPIWLKIIKHRWMGQLLKFGCIVIKVKAVIQGSKE